MLKSISMLCAAASLALPGAALAQISSAVPDTVDQREAVAPKEAFGTVEGTTWIDAYRFHPGASIPSVPPRLVPYPQQESFLTTTSAENVRYRSPLEVPVGVWLDTVACHFMIKRDPGRGVFNMSLLKYTRGSNLAQSTGHILGSASWYAPGSYPKPQTTTATVGHLVTHLISGDALNRQKYLINIKMNDEFALFGCEARWHRVMSPAPNTRSFSDVPRTSNYFQAIEALAASGITAGCGSDRFCPDDVVTRKQMAVFLAKALGLNPPK